MSFRSDGSYNSSNNPIESNRYMVFDNGMYKAQISKVSYIDSPNNNTANDTGPEVQYEVRIVGGQRDGQIFSNVVDMQLCGGITNYSERGWKATSTLTKIDPANVLNPAMEPPKKLNGDIVYIQFINGDIHYPVILGGAKHASNISPGAETADHQKYTTSFNGISTEIDKDGVFTWTKATGLYSPAPLLNEDGQLLWDQFVPIIGMEDAISVSVDNNLLLKISVNPVPDLGISIAIDGIKDSFTVTTALGDVLQLSSTGGFNATLMNGSKIAISPLGKITLQNTLGAKLVLNETSFVSLGNSTGDALQLLKQLLTALTTEAPPGFGGPLSNLATYISLLTQLTLITG